MEVRDLPVLGKFVAIGTVLFDLVIQSGDMVIVVLWMLLENIELIVPILSTLNRLAADLPSIDEGLVSDLLMVALALYLVYQIIRLVNSFRDNND